MATRVPDTGTNPLGHRFESPVLLRSCVVSWDQRFAEPIVLDDGSKLLTLREAIAHFGKIISKSGPP